MNRLLLGFLVLQIAILTTVILPAETRTQPASATPAFDYSNCQYPDRTTNPPNGCDNSDPCDPAQVKGGSGDCLPQSTTIEPEKPTTTPVQNTNSLNQCGGK